MQLCFIKKSSPQKEYKRKSILQNGCFNVLYFCKNCMKQNENIVDILINYIQLNLYLYYYNIVIKDTLIL